MRKPLPSLRGEISVQSLHDALPEDHRRWVRAGAWLTIAGYGALAVGRFATGESVSWSEAVVLVVATFAVRVRRAERVQWAAWALIIAVLGELLVSYARMPEGVRMIGGFAAPALIVAVGLFSGARAALVVALALSVAIPSAVALGGALGIGPGLQRADGMALVALVASLNAAAFLLHVFLQSFGRVVEASRRHAKRAQGLVEASPDGVLALGADGTVHALNSTAERLLEVVADEVVGRRMEEAEGVLADLAAPASQWDAHAPREVSLGSGIVLEVVTRRLPEGTEPITTLCLLRDITLRRRAEAAFEDLQTRLHHAQKLEAIGRLAGGVAHDFNNLLTAIGSHAETLESAPTAEVREVAAELVAVRNRGAALTRQLLAFARREIVQAQPVDLAHVIEESQLLLRRLVGARVELVLELEPSPVVADPGQVEQILLNLAANARDAMPHGGRLAIRCSGAGEDTVDLVIEDTGQGMAPATQERAFEPFFTTKEPGAGSGLGLATVHGIVAQYGGTIELDSELGRGTKFTIRWPRGPEAPGSLRLPTVSLRPTAGAKVLLVEDDPEARRGVRRLLRQVGYDVVEASGPREALELPAELQPDIVLSDMVMPGMNGLEFVARWRVRQPEVPVIYISGYSEDALEGDLGGDELLRKPFSRDEIVTVIELQMRRGRPRHAGARDAAS